MSNASPSAANAFLASASKVGMSNVGTEHSYRPCLKILFEALGPVTAINEPRRTACGAPDFVIRKGGFVVGHVEAKSPDIELTDIEDSEQIDRYRKNLENLLLVNNREVRWYVRGVAAGSAILAEFDPDKPGTFKPVDVAGATALIEKFLSREVEQIGSAELLALRLAGLADSIRSTIVEAYEHGLQSPMLEQWRAAVTKVLIADLGEASETPRFADMIAQTLAYGLFTARIMSGSTSTFTRQEAQTLIPRSNPFLRQFFYQISSPDIEDELFAIYVDEIVTVLANTNVNAILEHFGEVARSRDPVVHFYETFLQAYDPDLRDLRGVYYTPHPVVSYLTRSVDSLLASDFGCADGLADASKIAVSTGKQKGGIGKKSEQFHKVMVLDPACGTGAFLYEVISIVRQRFIAQNNAGLWRDYVHEHLLPRLFGFEILMAPYAIAHFKVGLELLAADLPDEQKEIWKYEPAPDERLGIYLTNTLEPAHEFTGLPLFTQWLSDETNLANRVKVDAPILVMIGNPPYNNFGKQNKNDHVAQLLLAYKKGLGEKKANLDDDYIKFIRFAQDKIDNNGSGIVAFITNSSFISGIIHRKMRQSLRDSFSDIYVLNLHGDVVSGEVAPNGAADRNVFDIKQGVAATIFVKRPKAKLPGKIWYCDLWGARSSKYEFLEAHDISTVKWEELTEIEHESCLGKFYFFRPTDNTGIDEYCAGVGLDQVFSIKLSGIQTKRDGLFVDQSRDRLAERMKEVLTLGPTEKMREKYPLEDSGGWTSACLVGATFDDAKIRRYLYRPFDWRYIYYDETLLGRPRPKVSRHFLHDNIGLSYLRQTVDDAFRHVLVCDGLTDINYLMSHHVSDRIAPLYLYGKLGADLLKRSNLTEYIKSVVSALLGIDFVETGKGDRITSWGPEDLLAYIYAILWAPEYRERYGEFLKISYPRIPFAVTPPRFWELADMGSSLIDLHLLRGGSAALPSYPVAGGNKVSRPRWAEEKLYINNSQYLADVPKQIWDHKIGCYSAISRWLSQRKGGVLSSTDLNHLRKSVAALGETPPLLTGIDDLLRSPGGLF